MDWEEVFIFVMMGILMVALVFCLVVFALDVFGVIDVGPTIQIEIRR